METPLNHFVIQLDMHEHIAYIVDDISSTLDKSKATVYSDNDVDEILNTLLRIFDIKSIKKVPIKTSAQIVGELLAL